MVFPPQPSCLFRELIYEMHGQARYRVSWNPHKHYLCSCSTCIPKNTCAYFGTCCLSKPFTKYLFLKIVKIHMKISEPESLFHKVAGLQPAVLLKKILRLRCFPVNFHKFLKNVFHRTPLGDCFLKFYFRFIMGSKWRIVRHWRIVIHKSINSNQSIKTQIPSDSVRFHVMSRTNVSIIFFT